MQRGSKLRTTGDFSCSAPESKKADKLTPKISASLARESMAIEDRPRSNWERKPIDSPDSSLSCFRVYFLAVRKALTLAPMVIL